LNSGHSRSALFLIEQLVVILIFAICAAICVSIFAESYLMGRKTLEINNAIRVAANGAESFKATGGDVNRAAQILGAVNSQVDYGGDLVVYYDDEWNTSSKEQASYVLQIKEYYHIFRPYDGAYSLLLGDAVVSRLENGEEIFSLMVTARNDIIAAGEGGR
jgi:type II secretory pathway pseudopilin PulG